MLSHKMLDQISRFTNAAKTRTGRANLRYMAMIRYARRGTVNALYAGYGFNPRVQASSWYRPGTPIAGVKRIRRAKRMPLINFPLFITRPYGR